MTFSHHILKVWKFGKRKCFFNANALRSTLTRNGNTCSMCQTEQTVCKQMTDVKL